MSKQELERLKGQYQACEQQINAAKSEDARIRSDIAIQGSRITQLTQSAQQAAAKASTHSETLRQIQAEHTRLQAEVEQERVMKLKLDTLLSQYNEYVAETSQPLILNSGMSNAEMAQALMGRAAVAVNNLEE